MILRFTGLPDLPCEAVLLDMDGTLVDSGGAVEAKWRRYAERHGLDGDEVVRASQGRPTAETMRQFGPYSESERDELDAYEEGLEEGIGPVPGAVELMAALPADRRAVVTAAWPSLARLRLGLAGLPVPDVLITCRDTPAGKPDPAGYLLAAARLGVDPAACVVFEDAPAGVAAARAAHMRVVALTTTFPDLTGDRTIPDLRGVSAG